MTKQHNKTKNVDPTSKLRNPGKSPNRRGILPTPAVVPLSRSKDKPQRRLESDLGGLTDSQLESGFNYLKLNKPRSLTFFSRSATLQGISDGIPYSDSYNILRVPERKVLAINSVRFILLVPTARINPANPPDFDYVYEQFKSDYLYVRPFTSTFTLTFDLFANRSALSDSSTTFPSTTAFGERYNSFGQFQILNQNVLSLGGLSSTLYITENQQLTAKVNYNGVPIVPFVSGGAAAQNLYEVIIEIKGHLITNSEYNKLLTASRI